MDIYGISAAAHAKEKRKKMQRRTECFLFLSWRKFIIFVDIAPLGAPCNFHLMLKCNVVYGETIVNQCKLEVSLTA